LIAPITVGLHILIDAADDDLRAVQWRVIEPLVEALHVISLIFRTRFNANGVQDAD
jgi:hypothetical protein